jgi:putative ABC transport system permease protein
MNNAWKNLFRPRKAENELDAEMRDHLERQIAENLRRGMTPEQARRQALLSLGGVEQVKEECRDERPARLMADLWRDLRHSFRGLARRPGFTAVAVITMALGIGANTAVFSVVYGVLMRPLPFTNGERIVVLRQMASKAGVKDISFGAKEIDDYRGQNRTLDGVVEHHTMSFLLLGGEEPLRVQTGVVSPNFFDLFGVKVVLGRTFSESDDRHDAPGVLILTDRFWREHFGADPKIVGRVFQMSGRAHTVIGVLPPIPQYPIQDDIYMPVSSCPTRSSAGFIANRDARMMTVFGLLKPGVTVEQARADTGVIAGRLEHAYPDTYKPEYGYGATADMLREELSVRAKANMAPLLAAAGFVLLIACASVANLMLARVTRQERELAIRAALGATRGRLVRQLLTESLLLSLGGGVLGLMLAPVGISALTLLAAQFSPRSGEIRIDMPVLLFTLAVSIATGILFGLAPATGSRKDPNDALKEGGAKTTDSHTRQRMRKALVVCQLAFSFVLLAGAGLAIRSLWKLLTVQAGYRTDHVLVMRFSTSAARYQKHTDFQSLYARILDTVHQVPGVRSAAVSLNYPLNPNALASDTFNSREFQIEGHPLEKGKLGPRVEYMVASPEYLDTLAIPLITGRWFNEQDRDETLKVAAINESMAKHRWPGEDPRGKRVSFDDGKTWLTIQGIIGNVKEMGLDRPVPDALYVPVKQDQFGGNNLLVRTASDPESVIRAVTQAIHQAGADVAVDRVRTLERVRQESISSPRLTAMLLSMFALLALLITAVGLGGVLALGVSQRRQELGIRMALGATHGTLVRMVLTQGLRLAGLGIAIGLPASLALTRLVSALLYDTQPNDTLTLTCVAGLLALVAAVACFVPARQATRIDPLVALRAD